MDKLSDFKLGGIVSRAGVASGSLKLQPSHVLVISSSESPLNMRVYLLWPVAASVTCKAQLSTTATISSLSSSTCLARSTRQSWTTSKTSLSWWSNCTNVSRSTNDSNSTSKALLTCTAWWTNRTSDTYKHTNRHTSTHTQARPNNWTTVSATYTKNV